MPYLFFRHGNQNHAQMRYNPELSEFIAGKDKVKFYSFLESDESIKNHLGEYEHCDLHDPQIISAWTQNLSSKRISYF